MGQVKPSTVGPNPWGPANEANAAKNLCWWLKSCHVLSRLVTSCHVLSCLVAISSMCVLFRRNDLGFKAREISWRMVTHGDSRTRNSRALQGLTRLLLLACYYYPIYPHLDWNHLEPISFPSLDAAHMHYITSLRHATASMFCT